MTEVNFLPLVKGLDLSKTLLGVLIKVGPKFLGGTSDPSAHYDHSR